VIFLKFFGWLGIEWPICIKVGRKNNLSKSISDCDFRYKIYTLSVFWSACRTYFTDSYLSQENYKMRKAKKFGKSRIIDQRVDFWKCSWLFILSSRLAVIFGIFIFFYFLGLNESFKAILLNIFISIHFFLSCKVIFSLVLKLIIF
jgi:hypothetical protein